MAGSKLTKADFDKAVADLTHGHTDLTTFHTVIQIMEGGGLYDPKSHAAASRIIKICQQEAQRLLRMHDAGRAALAAQQKDGGQ